MEIPSVITVTVNKRSIIETVGVTMKMKNRKIVVSAISGLALDTDLRIGHEILSVNGIPTKDSRHAADLMRKSYGRVTIVASSGTPEEGKGQSLLRISTVSINTSPISKSLGVWFETPRGVIVRVARIADNSPFAKSRLQAGDAVLSINGVIVTSAAQAERLVSLPMGASRTAKSMSIISFSMERWRRTLLLAHLNTSSAVVSERRKNYTVEAIENTQGDEFRAERKDRKYLFRFRFDARNQKCEICEPWMYTQTQSDIKYNRKAFRKMLPKLKAMNKVIESKMQELESAVMSNYVAADHVVNSFIENLAQLGDMHEVGLLDNVEFSAAKAQLLGLYEQSTLIAEAIPSQVIDERIPAAIVHTAHSLSPSAASPVIPL